MAGGAGNPRVRSKQRETCIVVVKTCRLPGSRGVAGIALRTELAVMRIIGGVTGKTGCRGARKDIVDMAGAAFHASVHSGQREGGGIVIKRGRLPGSRGMAGIALRAELTVMRVIRRMTGNTGCGSARKDVIDMAGAAFHAGVRSQQWEAGLAMIKCRIFPGSGGMTRCTLGSKLAFVRIVF